MHKERKENSGGICMRGRFYKILIKAGSPAEHRYLQNTGTAATLAQRNSGTPRTGTKSLFMGLCHDMVTIAKTFL